MRESAEDLNAMLETFGRRIDVDDIFGITGKKGGVLYLSNFFVEEYDGTKAWLKYLINTSNIINKQSITEQLTSLRYSTSIDSSKGVAKEHSLRTERVINGGKAFIAYVQLPENYETDMALICQNIRRMGTKRTRGFGEIEIVFIKGGKILNKEAIDHLEKGVS